jgi:hypothetical protein
MNIRFRARPVPAAADTAGGPAAPIFPVEQAAPITQDTDPIDTNVQDDAERSIALPQDDSSTIGPARHADYEIGYGKPPPHSRFKPGQTGNPKGRPKGSLNMATIVAKELARKIKVREAGRIRNFRANVLIARRQVNKALNGDLKSAEFLMRFGSDARTNPDSPASGSAADPAHLFQSRDGDVLAHYRQRVLEEEAARRKLDRGPDAVSMPDALSEEEDNKTSDAGSPAADVASPIEGARQRVGPKNE